MTKEQLLKGNELRQKITQIEERNSALKAFIRTTKNRYSDAEGYEHEHINVRAFGMVVSVDPEQAVLAAKEQLAVNEKRWHELELMFTEL